MEFFCTFIWKPVRLLSRLLQAEIYSVNLDTVLVNIRFDTKLLNGRSDRTDRVLISPSKRNILLPSLVFCVSTTKFSVL